MSITLAQYAQENPTKTLTEIQTHPEITGKKLSADLMRSFLNHPQVQLYNYFKGATSDAEPTLIGTDYYNVGDLKMTTFDNMAGVGEFNFITGHPSDQAGLIDVLMYAETDPAIQTKLGTLKALCLGYCNQEYLPFANATQSQINMIKGVFTSKTITHTVGRELTVDLKNNLTERVAATLWLCRVGFADRSMGKNIHMQEINKYVIPTDGVKSGEYEVRVPLLEADFSVESI